MTSLRIGLKLGMNKNFNHKQLIDCLNNVDIEKYHSIELILDDLNGEQIIGHSFNKDDPFSLDPISTDIGMQLKKLDRNIIYEPIFELNEDYGKDISVEYGLISSKKYDSSFLIYLYSIGGDNQSLIINKFKKISSEKKNNLSTNILRHFKLYSDAYKYNRCRNVYISKGYKWDLDELYNLLNKIIQNHKTYIKKPSISVWRHRLNQKKLTFECIKVIM